MYRFGGGHTFAVSIAGPHRDPFSVPPEQLEPAHPPHGLRAARRPSASLSVIDQAPTLTRFRHDARRSVVIHADQISEHMFGIKGVAKSAQCRKGWPDGTSRR